MVNPGPELQPSTFGLIDSINADSLVIEAYVDANGRVQDYRIPSGPGGLGVGAAGGEAHADLHDIPSWAVDGAAHAQPGGALVLEDQSETISARYMQKVRSSKSECSVAF
jgi:hypothetical protein